MDIHLTVLIIIALAFDFLNGVHDSSNIVATIISSRSLSPRAALMLTAISEFCGPFLFGVAVAKTVGSEIIPPGLMTMPVLISALTGAILWNIITWFLGVPSSSSHALIGGLIGATTAGVGFDVIQMSGLNKVFIALFLSPVIGLAAGFVFTRLVYVLAASASMKINLFFKRVQVLTGIGLALSHGAIDAQNTMGIITLGLVTTGALDSFEVPLWVIGISALAIAMGTLSGGWRLIKTLGAGFFRVRPVHGFCAQMTSASVILGAALLGGPVSTTQVVSSAILGVGAADRVNKVRWHLAANILTAWLITIPLSGLMAAGTFVILTYAGI
ncbi:MAG: inorganic phosphate transporter [Leptolinea sp.]|nr:inorganic phosphate transporter [Leptolinea sp.]